MPELNPDNPMVQAMREQWQKLLAIVMDKNDLAEVRISVDDINHLSYRFGGELPVIVVREKDEQIILQLARESDAQELAEIDRRERSEKAKVTLSGAPAEPGIPGAPQPIDPATGMHRDYWILSDEERAKGFMRPVRQVYVHKKCGTTTRMGIKLAETYARDPKFYGSTFCCNCAAHFPVAEFVWDGTDQVVGS